MQSIGIKGLNLIVITLSHKKKGQKQDMCGYPITVKSQAPFSRDEMVKYLEEKRIETRPIQI
ncbi:MAG: hypothetical protein QXM38_03670 [Candidatus Aenigmatarchaeota archaeon]